MKLVISLLFGISATLALAAPPATPAPKKKPLPPLGTAMDRPGAKSTPKPQAKSALTPPAKPPATPPPAPNLAAAAASRGLSFDVRTLAHGGGQGEKGVAVGSEGQVSEVRLRGSQITIEILVRNLAREADTARFECLFVGKGVSSEVLFVWDRVERQITVPGGDHKRETVQSEEVLSAETRTRYSSSSSSSSSGSQKKESGSRAHGWIVRAFVGEHLVKVQASNTTLDRIGNDPAQLASLLKQKPPLAPGESEKSKP
ncbi:MAG: hypothetical protein K8R23_08425 [Chthoniobacter sp.]|nr:hypothetical protein [Chthoniobacter sp.]